MPTSRYSFSERRRPSISSRSGSDQSRSQIGPVRGGSAKRFNPCRYSSVECFGPSGGEGGREREGGREGESEGGREGGNTFILWLNTQTSRIIRANVIRENA